MKTGMFSRKGKKPREDRPSAPQSMVDFASENWRIQQVVQRSAFSMDPMDAERLLNQFAWYQRKAAAVLAEADLRVVDLTGQDYDVGMAVSPLNLEDFPDHPDARYQIEQMVEPIVMEHGTVRKPGTVMLKEITEP